MASKFEIGNNFVENYLFYLLLNNVDLLDNDISLKTFTMIIQILRKNVGVEEIITFLDFDIKGDNKHIRVVPNNLISALWLCGIFPDNVYDLTNKNKYSRKNTIFNYNKKTKRLTKISKNE